MSDNLRGILLMCVAMLAFTINDSFMKAASVEMPMFQAILLRGLATTAALLVLARGRANLWPGKRQMLALRTLAEIGATVAFLVALTHMPLANLSAIMQALPLAIALSAALFLGAPIGWRRMVAITVGFVGVMLIVKPGTDGFDKWSVLGLLSVAGVVVRDLSTRQMPRDVPTMTVAIWASGAVALMGAVVVAWEGWQDVPGHSVALTLAASVALVVGYLTSVMVMRVGDIAVIAPFRYTALIWAILFGWVLFGSLPDRWTMLGAGIVVASGIYTLWRDAVRARA